MAITKKDGTIIIDTLINTKGFNKGAGNMQKSISGLSGTISKLGVAIGVAFSARAVINFGKECINLGSDLQEVQNVVDVTFGNMSDRINEFAENAITQFGLSELAAKQYASTMGAMLKSMEFNQADVLEMSTTLAGLAGDIASFYNLTGDKAFTKIRAGISGETEPLKQLGINLSVANLEAFALAEGITKSYNAMTEQEKAMLRYNYLLKTTADAQGDFARTSDSWANQTRILAEQFNSLKATIGQGLINAFTPAIKVLNTLLAKLQTLANAFKALTEELFGKQVSQQASNNLGSIEDGYNDITDATNDAKKAQDKYTNSLDELNVISKDDATFDNVVGGILGSDITGEIAEDVEKTDGIFEDLEKRFPRLLKFLNDMSKKLKEIAQDIKIGDFKELSGDISALAVMLFDFISEAIQDVDWESIGTKIGDFLSGIDWVGVVKAGFRLKFNIWKAIADVWFGAFSAAPIETAIITALGLLKFSGVGNLLAGKIRDSLLTSVASWGPHVAFASIATIIVGKIVDAMKGAFDTSDWSIWDWITNTLETSKEGWMVQLDMWRVQLEVWWQDTWLYSKVWELEQWWNEKIAPIQEKWDELYKGITDSSDKFAKGFSSAWEFIVTAVKDSVNNIISIINFMISGVTAGINLLIDGLNAIKFDAPDWLGGKSFALNIPKISASQIPYLATGAVIPPNAPFMAMLGDQRNGANLEAPESLIRQIVREEAGGSAEMMALLSEIAQNTRETADKDLTIGDRDIARANIRGQQSMGYSLITVG